MTDRNASTRSGFTLLEALLILALLGIVLSVSLAAGTRSLRAIQRAEALEEAGRLAELLAVDPEGRILEQVGDLPQTSRYRWKVSEGQQQIVDGVALRQWTIVITSNGEPLCRLQLLDRAINATDSP